MATCAEPAGLKFPVGSGTLIQGSSALSCQSSAVVVETLFKAIPAVATVPRLSVRSAESGLTTTLGLNPVVEVR